MTETVYVWRTKPPRGQKHFEKIPVSELEDFKAQQDVISKLTSDHNALVGRVDELSQMVNIHHPEPRNCPGCDLIPPSPTNPTPSVPAGLRWHEDSVGFHFSDQLPGSEVAWLMEEYEILKEFVETNTPLKLFVSRFAGGAQIKNITIDELDGPGGTLGETRYSFIEAENRMVEATVVCDVADQGPSKRATKKHEFGHCFGIPHDPDPDALMYFALNTATDYGPNILKEFQMRHPMLALV